MHQLKRTFVVFEDLSKDAHEPCFIHFRLYSVLVLGQGRLHPIRLINVKLELVFNDCSDLGGEENFSRLLHSMHPEDLLSGSPILRDTEPLSDASDLV